MRLVVSFAPSVDCSHRRGLSDRSPSAAVLRLIGHYCTLDRGSLPVLLPRTSVSPGDQRHAPASRGIQAQGSLAVTAAIRAAVTPGLSMPRAILVEPAQARAAPTEAAPRRQRRRWSTDPFRGPQPRQIPAIHDSKPRPRIARSAAKLPANGKLIAAEGNRFTRERSLVRAQPCP